MNRRGPKKEEMPTYLNHKFKDYQATHADYSLAIYHVYVSIAKMTQSYAFLFCLIFVFGCTPSTDLPGSEHAAKEVTEMLHKYHLAIAAGGLEAEFDYLDDTEEFFWVPPGYQSALDFDSVASVLRATDPAIAKTILEWDTLRVIPLRKDLVQFYGTITMISTDTAGVKTSGHLVETGLVVKRPDGWKLLNGQSAFFKH